MDVYLWVLQELRRPPRWRMLTTWWDPRTRRLMIEISGLSPCYLTINQSEKSHIPCSSHPVTEQDPMGREQTHESSHLFWASSQKNRFFSLGSATLCGWPWTNDLLSLGLSVTLVHGEVGPETVVTDLLCEQDNNDIPLGMSPREKGQWDSAMV